MSTMTISEGLDVTIASATALPASGGFAVLRVAASDATLLDHSTPVLHIEHYLGVRKLLPVESFGGYGFGSASVDFLVPTELLSGPLALDIGTEVVPLPAVETASAPAVDVAAAYMAQQDELADLDHRVKQLRAELRDTSNHAAAAEDALASATERFQTALIVQRREVGVVSDQLEDLRLSAAQTEAELRAELATKNADIARIALARSETEAELEAARTREIDAANEHAASLAAAHAAAAAAESEVEDLTLERRRLEGRIGTLDRARVDAEADRIADRQAADRWLSMAIASRDMLLKRVNELEHDRDSAAEGAAQTEAELRAELAAKNAQIARVTLERTETEAELQAARTREIDAANEHTASLAAAHAAAAAAESDVEDLTLERRRLEGQVGTHDRARVDAEADRIADRQAADRWLSMAIASRDMLLKRVNELEHDRDSGVDDRLVQALEERDELSARVEAVQCQLQELEERQRTQGKAAIVQLDARLESQRVAANRRIEAAEREAERRIAAAEDSTIVSTLGVRNLDLDGLADLYAIAERERSSAERRGKLDFAQCWAALARFTVDDARRRPESVAAGIEKLRTGRARAGRFVRGRSARARRQLNAAVLHQTD
jgi:chromosome segregation ATPase